MNMTPIEIASARKILLGEVAFISLLVLAILPFSKLRVDFASFAPLFYLSGVLLLAAGYCNFRQMPRYTAALETVGCGLFMTVPILIGTYLAIAADFPLADSRLDAMDGALGFDWFAFIHFIDARAALAHWLGEAYQTISFQLLLLPIALALLHRPQRAYAMVTGYGILCVLASLIAMFYPALGTYAYYGLDYHSVKNINPFFALEPVPDFNAVRDQTAYTLVLGSASGLLCFPSVHAGVAYLSTWAAWDVKLLRYPILLLNIAMTVAAVSHANHYLVDIIAGLGVSALTTAIVTALFYQTHLRQRLAQRFATTALEPAE